MKSIKQRALAVTAASAVLLAPGLSYGAQGVNFNPNGTGPGGSSFTDLWTWSNTTLLVDEGLLPSPTFYTGQTGKLLVQGIGSIAFDGLATVFDSSVMSDFSFVMSIPVEVARIDGSGDAALGAGDRIEWVLNPVDSFGADNFWELHNSAQGFNTSTGTGFDSGPTILSGKVFFDTNLDNQLRVTSIPSPLPGLGTGASAVTWNMTGNLNTLIDVCDSSEIAGGANNAGAGAACKTQGSASVIDTGFFPLVDFVNLPAFTFNASLGGQLADPFGSIVPDSVVGETPELNRAGDDTDDAGAVNDIRCEGLAGEAACDVVADVSKPGSGQATTAWFSNPIPEPASLALVGLGMLGMGAFRRRRQG